jgi:hypothetical protein
MTDCCSTKEYTVTEKTLCPECRNEGKKVKLITLKSLLNPQALVRIDANSSYFYCSNSNCNVVYFDYLKNLFYQHDIKVPVYPKSKDLETPICYCFGWTIEKIDDAVNNTGMEAPQQYPVNQIQEHIKANRCGCEVNNPQGSCCLGNVNSYIKNNQQIKDR